MLESSSKRQANTGERDDFERLEGTRCANRALEFLFLPVRGPIRSRFAICSIEW